MQTTLLSFAIIVIVALLAALLGPLFVDWSSYRAEFEARASRLTGLEFRVTGPIDVRLLPTPMLTMQGIEFGRPGDDKVRARKLHIEFALGRLLQGEWRIEDAKLEGPEFGVRIDHSGRIAWPIPAMGFTRESISIQRLDIEDGRAALVHDASGARLLLENMEFKGDVRSLAGPVRGEGSFVVAGDHYPYRIAMSRVGPDGSIKIRLNIDPVERPLTAEADFSVRLDRGMPRVEGSVAFARPPNPASEEDFVSRPWRVTSRFQGDSSAMMIEQIEAQYGRDDRAVSLRGNAKLTLGSQPQLKGTLTSPQIDLDRMLSLPEETRRRPFTAIKSLANYLPGPQHLPFAVKLGFSTETLTFAGSVLQRVSGDVSIDGDIWEIGNVDLRAPGLTQIQVSGRFDPASKGIAFKGPVKIDSGDPRLLLAWLTDRIDPQTIAAAPFRLNGDIAFGSDSIAIDRFDAEIDRMRFVGRFAYSRASVDRPARLDAALTAPEINLDRVHALAKAILGDTEFDRPRQGSLSLDIGRALIGGIEARQSDVKMRIESDGLEIEQLAIADFAGAALAAKGRIDTRGQSPRGAVTFNFDARSLDGVTALIEKFAVQAADQLRRFAGRVSPVRLRGSLALDPAAAGSAGIDATAKFQIDGRAGHFRVALQGDAGVAGDAFKIDDPTTLGAAKVTLSGRLESDDASALINLTGLERFVVVDRRPGVLRVSAKGPLDGDLAVDGQLVAGALSIWARGTVRAPNGTRPRAGLEITVADANLPLPRTLAQARGPELLNASGSLRLSLAEGQLRLTDMKGTVAGASVGGRLAIDMQQQPMGFDGEFEMGMWDLPEVIGNLLGIPTMTPQAASAGVWPAEPFDPPPMPGISGQIAVQAATVALTPKLAARDFRGKIHFGESQFALQVIDGSIAGGRIAGELILLRRPDGIIARTRVRLTDAEAAQLLPGNGSLSGKLTLDVAAEGAGMSPIALINALEGRGSLKLADGKLARLNPQAFDTVMRAYDRGMPMDAARLRDRMDSALASGPLAIRRAEAGITIEAGQVRMLSNPILDSSSVDLVVSGRINLAEGTLDGRLTLSGTRGAGSTVSSRPEIEIALKGPIESVQRRTDATAFANWLALRAVEEQSKKLDRLEGSREPASAVPTTDAPMPTRPSSPALREPVRAPIDPP